MSPHSEPTAHRPYKAGPTAETVQQVWSLACIEPMAHDRLHSGHEERCSSRQTSPMDERSQTRSQHARGSNQSVSTRQTTDRTPSSSGARGGPMASSSLPQPQSGRSSRTIPFGGPAPLGGQPGGRAVHRPQSEPRAWIQPEVQCAECSAPSPDAPRDSLSVSDHRGHSASLPLHVSAEADGVP